MTRIYLKYIGKYSIELDILGPFSLALLSILFQTRGPFDIHAKMHNFEGTRFSGVMKVLIRLGSFFSQQQLWIFLSTGCLPLTYNLSLNITSFFSLFKITSFFIV